MDFTAFEQASIAHQHNGLAVTGSAYPAALAEILGAQDGARARQVIESWPGYRATPLRRLSGFAQQLGLAAVFYKDEGSRFGLGSFKALGGAYAVLRLLSTELQKQTGASVSDTDIASGATAEAARSITVVTATDGNHGRSVAWGAQQFGCGCKIYMHAGVSPGRAQAVEALGAEVVWVEGNYDDSVRQAAADAAANGWFIVSDTSYEGYMDLPRQVMAGYTVMTGEVLDQLPDGPPPSHVFLQGGVGGLAGAVASHLWQAYGEQRPRIVIVEPDRAACLYQSARQGEPVIVAVEEETIMAGLSCGEVSLLGWEILRSAADDFLCIPDELVAPVMRALAEGGADEAVVAGESAVAGLAGLIAARRSAALSEALGLDESSRVLLFGTEGATDPEIYREIVGRAPEDIAA